MTLKSNLMLGCGSLLIAAIATPALSDDAVSVSVVRSNMQTVAVDAKSLVRIAVNKNAVTRLEFPKEESLDTVAFSDTKNWQIMPAENKSMLFVKPTAAASSGNMHVITKVGGKSFSYQFELSTRKTGVTMKDVGYVIRLTHSQKGAQS